MNALAHKLPDETSRKLDLGVLDDVKVLIRARKGVSETEVADRMHAIADAARRVRHRAAGEEVALDDEVTVDLVAYYVGSVCLVEHDASIVISDESHLGPLLLAMVGQKVGAQCSFSVTLDERAPKGLQNQTIGVAMTMRGAAVRLKLSLEQGLLCAGYGHDLEAARDRVREELLAERAKDLTDAARERTMNMLQRSLGWTIADVDIDDVLERVFIEREGRDLESAGVPTDLIRHRKTAFLVDPRSRDAAKRDLFANRFLDAAADALGLELDPAALAARIREVAVERGVPLSGLDPIMKRQQGQMKALAAQRRRGLALEHVLERVRVEFV